MREEMNNKFNQRRYDSISLITCNSLFTYTQFVDFVEALLIGTNEKVRFHLEQFVHFSFDDFGTGILALHFDSSTTKQWDNTVLNDNCQSFLWV